MVEPHFHSRSIYEEEPAPGVRQLSPRQFPVLRRKQRSLRRLLGSAAAIGHLFLVRRKDGRLRPGILRLFLALLAIGSVTFAILWFTLPNIDDPQTLFAAQSTVIYDRNGTELYRLFSEQDRTYVPGDKIATNVKNATIAIEDERFFERGCFDAIGFLRAVISQVVPGFVRSGGSTLTQQFAKNALVGNQRSVFRKARELMLACKLESRYDKPHMLELYLNWIPYGKNAYGIEQASKNYFGVSASDLTLAQAAVLAAIVQAPSYYNPYGSHVYSQGSPQVLEKIRNGTITASSQISEKDIYFGIIGHTIGGSGSTIYAGGRTDQVLKNMLDQGMIQQAEYTKALADLQTMTFAPARENIRAPHFVLWIEKQIETIFNLNEQNLTQGGLKITTTLDWDLQQLAEKAVAAHKEDVLKRFGAHNTALLSLAPQTREVLAYVGNSDYNDEEHEGKIDMIRAPRQPGSSFKPVVYATAFEAGYGPGTVTYDLQTKFGENTPQNYGADFMGLMTMRTALAGSRNIPAIKAFFLAGGEDKVLNMAQRLGIRTPAEQKDVARQTNPDFQYGYPMAIGTAETPLLEMAQAYATFADGGTYRPLVTLLKVTDRNGNILPLPKPDNPQEVLDPRIAAQITSILSDVNARPDNDYWKSILSVPGQQAAAKTGTSNKCLQWSADQKDCKLRHPESTWTMGFSPSLITGVWVGNATSQSLYDKADGLTTAAPIWHDYMTAAHKKLKPSVTAFTLPDGLTQPQISRLSGQLASACTPVELRTSDLFLKENTPTKDDTACVLMKVDKVTGLLASPACPADAVEERPFFVPESEQPTRWPLWEQAVQDWAKAEMVKWDANETHSGSHLPLPLPPTKECDPSLTPGRDTKPRIDLQSPRGGTGVPYPVFTPQISVISAAPIQKVEYFIDDKSVAVAIDNIRATPVRVPRSIPKDGTHTLKVVVTDKYYNTATDTSSFIFEDDRLSPHISLNSPHNGAVVRKNTPVTIAATADDAGGVETVQFFLDDTLLTTKRDLPYDLTYTIKTPGSHTLKAVATDNAGNQSQDMISVTVE